MFAIINGQVKKVTLGEAVEVVGVFTRRHPGHKVEIDGVVHHLSDELIYNTEERARKELAHLNRIWGQLVPR